MKYFAPLKNKDIVTLIGLVIAGFAWIMTDQLFLKSSSHRFIAFIIVMILLFQAQFRLNKPLRIWYYANTLSFILLSVTVLLSIVMHVIIAHDFVSTLSHILLLWLITGLMPHVSALIYAITGAKQGE
ncbi:MAG TPA: hypothetical protein VHO72_02735 [Bacteroidales bacterium]|nr:hypothetical protein [Bacteroidales bacterium]